MHVLFTMTRGARAFTEATMKRIKFGVGFTVFVLFFGVATLEAFQTRNWLMVILWLAIGIVFLAADNLHKPRVHD